MHRHQVHIIKDDGESGRRVDSALFHPFSILTIAQFFLFTLFTQPRAVVCLSCLFVCLSVCLLLSLSILSIFAVLAYICSSSDGWDTCCLHSSFGLSLLVVLFEQVRVRTFFLSLTFVISTSNSFANGFKRSLCSHPPKDHTIPYHNPHPS